MNRGLAMYQNLIIAPIIDGRLIALNAETGKPVWESRVSYSNEGYTVTMAPRIAKGKVIIGVAGAELPIRGFFSAFDAATGKFAWKFYTVPGDPSKPFENPALKKAAETWSGDYWKLGGGGSVWDGMAYDPDADLLYVGTGNGGPWPEELRKSKGKENLYLASILAVKPDTGELKWYFQVVPGDSWDYDSVQQLLLADVTIRGQQRKVLMQANKDGFYYVIDRVSGQFISGQPFAKVTWAKGLDERTGRPFINPEAHYGNRDHPDFAWPGRRAQLVAHVVQSHHGAGLCPDLHGEQFQLRDRSRVRVSTGSKQHRREAWCASGQRPGHCAAASSDTSAPPAIGPEAPPAGQTNVLVAWDPVAQKERWRTQGGGSIGGGTVTTAGNLVFQVIPDGRLVAYSADKGEKLLDIQTGLRSGMGPPMTYQLDGKQYVALMGGQGIVVARSAEPGAPPPPTTAQTVFPKLMTFVLDGKPLQ